MTPDTHLSLFAILWHRVTPIIGISIVLAWAITRCVNAFFM